MKASKHGRPWLTVCATYHPDVLTFNAMMYNPIIFLPTTAAAMAMGRLFIDYQRELAGGTNWAVAQIHAFLSHAPLAGSYRHIRQSVSVRRSVGPRTSLTGISRRRRRRRRRLLQPAFTLDTHTHTFDVKPPLSPHRCVNRTAV